MTIPSLLDGLATDDPFDHELENADLGSVLVKFSKIPQSTLNELAALVLRFGNSEDHEALTAARAITITLAAAGFGLQDLAETIRLSGGATLKFKTLLEASVGTPRSNNVKCGRKPSARLRKNP